MGFSILKEFPTKYVNGSEVAGHEVKLVISDVKKEQAFSPKTRKKEPLLVVFFEGKERGVCLGKQRANDIKQIVGSDDTDDWKGKTVTMYTEKKDAFGAVRDIIRFKA